MKVIGGRAFAQIRGRLRSNKLTKSDLKALEKMIIQLEKAASNFRACIVD